jgi:hypothetical protein
MKFYTLALSLGSLLVLGSSLQASTIYNYAFGGLGGDLGSNTHTFAPTGGGPLIIAAGYHGAGATSIDNIHFSSVDLYSKGAKAFPTNSSNENGLGLTNDPSKDDEVTPGNFIVLDLGNFAALHIADLDIYTGSSTGTEKWMVAGSNQAPFTATLLSQFQILSPGTTNGLQDIDSLAGDRYLYFTSMSGNVLLGGISVETVTPEPASAGLAGLALAGAGLLFRRRLSK